MNCSLPLDSTSCYILENFFKTILNESPKDRCSVYGIAHAISAYTCRKETDHSNHPLNDSFLKYELYHSFTPPSKNNIKICYFLFSSITLYLSHYFPNFLKHSLAFCYLQENLSITIFFFLYLSMIILLHLTEILNPYISSLINVDHSFYNYQKLLILYLWYCFFFKFF